MWASRCRWSAMSRAHPLLSCPGLKITNPSIRYQVSHPWLSFRTLIRGVICVFNYSVLTFKLIILNSVLTVYIHVFTLSLHKKIPACTSVINMCNYIYNYNVTLPITNHKPNHTWHLSLTLTVFHLNSSKSVLQYNMNTINTLNQTHFILH